LFSALLKLLTTKRPIGERDTDLYILVFGFGCLIVAFFIALLDVAVTYIRGSSLLGIERGYKVVFWWSIGAFITGMIGVSLDVLQPTIAACLVVAVSWLLLLSAIMGINPFSPAPSRERDAELGEEK
jgi:hypothetical protein